MQKIKISLKMRIFVRICRKYPAALANKMRKCYNKIRKVAEKRNYFSNQKYETKETYE